MELRRRPRPSNKRKTSSKKCRGLHVDLGCPDKGKTSDKSGLCKDCQEERSKRVKEGAAELPPFRTVRGEENPLGKNATLMSPIGDGSRKEPVDLTSSSDFRIKGDDDSDSEIVSPFIYNYNNNPKNDEGFSGAPPVVQVVQRLPNPPTGTEVYGPTLTANPRPNNGGDAGQRDDRNRSEERDFLEREGFYDDEEGRRPQGQESDVEDDIPVPGDLYKQIGSTAEGLGVMDREDDAFSGRRPY